MENAETTLKKGNKSKVKEALDSWDKPKDVEKIEEQPQEEPLKDNSQKKPQSKFGTSRNADEAMVSDAMRTKEILDREPKEWTHIPLSPFEKKGVYETITINGYRYTIQKGIRVLVPKPVADLINEHYNIEHAQTVGHEMSVDRSPEVRDKLNA